MDVLDLNVSPQELQQLNGDLQQVQPGPTTCNVEGYWEHFDTLRSYPKHWKNVHTEAVTSFSCLDCGNNFPTSYKVRRQVHSEFVGEPEGFDKLFVNPRNIVPFRVAPSVIREAVSRKRNDTSKVVVSDLQPGALVRYGLKFVS